MILRSAKKFFQRTFQSVKSFLSGADYQKLPKDNATPSPWFDSYARADYANACSQASHSELDKFYEDFSSRWDPEKTRKIKRGKKKLESSLDVKKQEKEVPSKSDTAINHYEEGRKEDHRLKMGSIGARREARRDPVEDSKRGRDRRSCLVAKKLKELEKIDVSNIDHVMDIEEVLHYYSLLTCPSYLDIVDKFFMEMYAEFLGIDTTLGPSHSSRLGQWTFRGHA